MPGTSALLNWLSEEDLEGVPTNHYWNDKKIESDKVWYVQNSEDYRALRYVQEQTNLSEAFEAGLSFLEELLGRPVEGRWLDLGAGVCWTSALLAKRPSVNKVYAVEMSRHRIVDIAPTILSQYGAPIEKVVRVIGDFTDVKLDDASVDGVVMSQAFHHALDVDKLLTEVHRVLVPGGGVVVVGEVPITIGTYLQRLVSHNIRGILWKIGMHRFVERLRDMPLARPKPLIAVRLRTLFPRDEEKGDLHSTRRQVRRVFKKANLELYFQDLELSPEKGIKATCNYIGLRHR